MRFRELVENDKEQWIKLAQLANNRDKRWAEQKFKSYVKVKKKKKILVVEEKSRLIGFVGIKGQDIEEKVEDALNKDYLLITWIAIIRDRRKKGLGSRILKECERYALTWKKKGIGLGCNNKIIPFYEKNGYKKVGRFINDAGREENLMIKEMEK